MTMTHKESVQEGLRAVRARGLPRAGAVSVPRRVLGRRARGRSRRSLDPHDDRRVSCSSRCRARAGSSRMPEDFPARLLKSSAREHGVLYVDDEVQSGVGRTGPVWAIEHYGVEPDLLVSGKSLGGGLPLAAVTGRAERHGRAGARRPRRHVRRQPGRVRRGHRGARRGRARRLPPARRRSSANRPARAARRDRDARRRTSARCAASARCSPSSSSPTARARSLRPSSPKRTTAGARERGLILLSCGTYGNVIRILVPLVIDDDDLARGLEILEESLVDARTPADVRLEERPQVVRRRGRGRRDRPRDPGRRVLHDARARPARARRRRCA